MSVKITNANNVLKIEVGDEVRVPDPETGSDNWNNEFVGTVDSIRPDTDGRLLATILDQDDEAFDIELDRLERP